MIRITLAMTCLALLGLAGTVAVWHTQTAAAAQQSFESVENPEITPPRLLRKVEPRYTKEARKAEIEGIVHLSIEVWEDGLAHNIRVLKGLGYGLDEKAIEAVGKWKFKPATKDGSPVRIQAETETKFKLL